MTTTHHTHSPHTYDRKPIIVARNECALPERGGRKYTPRPDRRRARPAGTPAAEPMAVGSYFHPHAALACQPERLDAPEAPFNVPALIPDIASESDESDTIITPPDAASLLPPRGSALNFLPHPASEQRGRERERGRKRSSTPRRPPLVHRSSFAPEEDEGCLGGF